MSVVVKKIFWEEKSQRGRSTTDNPLTLFKLLCTPTWFAPGQHASWRTSNPCLRLNYLYPSRSGIRIYKLYGPGSDPTWLDRVGCTGDEETLGSCEHRGWGVESCNHHWDVGVLCIEPGELSHWRLFQCVSHSQNVFWGWIYVLEQFPITWRHQKQSHHCTPQK